MDADQHWQAWLERYGADYATDEERRAAYRDFKTNLARYTEMFSDDGVPVRIVSPAANERW